MGPSCVLAVSGTPGTGKTHLCAELALHGWTVLSLADLAQQHGCIGAMDEKDDAAPIDVHRLADAWSPPGEGRWLVDGHLAHLLDADGIVLLRCAPAKLEQRLLERGYAEGKVRANVEWEMLAGHWSELMEFEIERPLLELDAGSMTIAELGKRVTAWVEAGLSGPSTAEHAAAAIDWLAESSN